ncbi:MAG: sporulation transcriptional regulator SpoIIID [Clostridia bacterium]|nr:sporulation transcriptional regulator SpoIIID [Clostridia bacterium]
MIRLNGSKERCEVLGEYLVNNEATVRRAAHRFGISKSTVHKDVTEKLKSINPSLAGEVKKILDRNKAERHLRGGEATREKFRKLNSDKVKQ